MKKMEKLKLSSTSWIVRLIVLVVVIFIFRATRIPLDIHEQYIYASLLITLIILFFYLVVNRKISFKFIETFFSGLHLRIPWIQLTETHVEYIFGGILLFLSLISINTFDIEQLHRPLISLYSTPNLILILELLLLAAYSIILARKYRNVTWKASSKRAFFIGMILILIILCGYFLRIFNVGNLAITEDEYNHLVSAIHLNTKGQLFYQRAAIYSYLSHYLFITSSVLPSLTSRSLAVLRMTSVFAGTLSIIFIYLIGKKIHNYVGLIAAFLFSFSTFAIGMSRYAREYSLYNLFLLVYTWSMIELFSILSRKKTLQHTLKIMFFSTIILITNWYYFAVDKGSTFRIVLIYLPIMMLAVFFSKVNKSSWHSLKKKVSDRKSYKLVFLLCVVMGGIFLYGLSKDTFLQQALMLSDIELRYFQFLFDPKFDYYESAVTWFSFRNVTYLTVLIFLLTPMLFIKRNQFTLLFQYLLLSAYLILFTFFVGRGFQSRYIFYAYPSLMIIMATSIYIMASLLASNKGALIAFIVAMILFFNPYITSRWVLLENKFPEKVYGNSLKLGVLDQKTGMVHQTHTPKFISKLNNNLKLSEIENTTLIVDNRALMSYFWTKYNFKEVILWNTLYGPNIPISDIQELIQNDKVVVILSEKSWQEFGKLFDANDIQFQEFSSNLTFSIHNKTKRIFLDRKYYVFPNELVNPISF